MRTLLAEGEKAGCTNEAVCLTSIILRGWEQGHCCPIAVPFCLPPHYLYCMPTGAPAASSLWRVMALTLLVLCIGMVFGLVALGILCKYQLIAKDLI